MTPARPSLPLFEVRDIVTAMGSPFTSAERWVAVMLADHINAHTREAWPSIRRLAALTALSQASVKRALARLVDGPLALFEKRPGARVGIDPSRYVLRPPSSRGAGLTMNGAQSERRPASSPRGLTVSRKGGHPEPQMDEGTADGSADRAEARSQSGTRPGGEAALPQRARDAMEALRLGRATPVRARALAQLWDALFPGGAAAEVEAEAARHLEAGRSAEEMAERMLAAFRDRSPHSSSMPPESAPVARDVASLVERVSAASAAGLPSRVRP